MASNLFSDNFSGTFSELLNGDQPNLGLSFFPPEGDGGSSENVADAGAGFRQNRPGNLLLPVTVSPVFSVSPGISPSIFLNSPTFLSSALSPYGISPQEALAQATLSLSHSHSHLGIQHHDFHSSSSTQTSMLPSSTTYQPSTFNTLSRISENGPHPERTRPPQSFPAPVDKPADDGFNWRKYGQKQVKGSEYPRSYYRCTSHNCPVKKKVERSFDGHITEIIYKGQHNHDPPQSGRRGKDSNIDHAGSSQGQMGNLHWSVGLGRDHEAISMQLNGPSDSEESGENDEQLDDDEDEGEPNAKRRALGAGPSDGPITHRTVTEPKIVVQTRSEVDLLDDGYRWRKYGQKVVKGNPNPRSYYKCTTTGCKVRKHVERASTDAKAVITTYEGKHNHDVPAARGGNANTVINVEAQNARLHNSVNNGQMNFGNNDQMPIALRLKEEQIVV